MCNCIIIRELKTLNRAIFILSSIKEPDVTLNNMLLTFKAKNGCVIYRYLCKSNTEVFTILNKIGVPYDYTDNN